MVARAQARYVQIADELRADIDSGIFPTGSSLPAESDMAARFEVAVGTVREALKLLVAEGTLNSRRGARKVVMRKPVQQTEFSEFRSFAQWVATEGRVPGGQVQKQWWDSADEEDARRLAVAAGSPILAVIRLRTIDGTPVMLEHTRYPEELGRKVEALREDSASVTNLLRQLFGIEFTAAEHLFSVGVLDRADAEHLGAAEGAPVLRHHRISCDRFGTPLERSLDQYLGGTVSLAVSNSRDSNPMKWIAGSWD